MKANELTKLANAAYGKRWKYTVADAMDVSREMLWRYENGHTPISDELADKFRKLFRRQIEKQRDMLDALLKSPALK